MTLAVVAVAATAFVDSVDADAKLEFGLFVAFVWLPVSGFVGVLARHRDDAWLDLAALVIDLSLVAAAIAWLDPGPMVPVLAQLLLVAYNTYLGGRRFGVLAGLAGFALVWLVAASGASNFDPVTLALYPLVVVSLAWLLDAAATERWEASSGLVRVSEKSDAILTGVAEAVVVTAVDGSIDQWNRAAERTFGCRAHDARHRTCSDVLGLRQDVRELDCSEGCPLLRLQGDGSDVEVWRTDAAGNRQPLLATAVPVFDANGALVEVVHSFRDITRLKQADEAKTMFLATASHELKTPLTVIRGFSQMLLMPDNQLAPAEQESALRAIDVRAGQLTGIVDRLLMSSRIEAGRIDLDLGPVDIVPILRERAEALQAAAGRSVELTVPVDLPKPWVDDDALATVVDHLLDNAVKYSPNGGLIRLECSTGDSMVTMVVEDEGVGMSEEEVNRCFERFWQAEPTDVRRFGGTGIGLYIVRSLVEAMGGRVSVASVRGAGTRFSVTLLRSDRLPEPKSPSRSADGSGKGRGEQSIIREYMRQLGVPVEASQ
jgi:PAS domain S-box-containing protein